jgi:hypothetical protein
MARASTEPENRLAPVRILAPKSCIDLSFLKVPSASLVYMRIHYLQSSLSRDSRIAIMPPVLVPPMRSK